MRARVIPVLLVRGAGLVKSVRFRDHRYIGDPINAVRIFNEKEADELILLDIDATPQGRGPNLKLIDDLASECFMPFAYGGGVSTEQEIQAVLATGAEKVCLRTAAVRDTDVVSRAAARFGGQALVVCLDVVRGRSGRYDLALGAGRDHTGIEAVDFAREMERRGAGELLITAVDYDGTMQGYDLEVVRRVAEAVSIPVIACGGAGTVHHFRQALDAGASAVAAGAMFVFHGKHRAVLISYPAASELEQVIGASTNG